MTQERPARGAPFYFLAVWVVAFGYNVALGILRYSMMRSKCVTTGTSPVVTRTPWVILCHGKCASNESNCYSLNCKFDYDNAARHEGLFLVSLLFAAKQSRVLSNSVVCIDIEWLR